MLGDKNLKSKFLVDKERFSRFVQFARLDPSFPLNYSLNKLLLAVRIRMARNTKGISL
jgi:hypothetical protein